MIETVVIKLGGMLLNSDVAMMRFFSGLYSYHQLFNQNILVVHGGDYWIDTVTRKVNCLTKKNNLSCLYKYHDNSIDRFLKIGLLSGTLNKYLINKAKVCHINTVGLCLTDGHILFLNKYKNNNFIEPIFGSIKLIQYLFSSNNIPIISPIGITEDHILTSIDSDYAAMSLAMFLKARLILLTDVNCIVDGKGNRIKELSKLDINKLIQDGIITSGMINKVETAIRFSSYSNQPVDIAGWQDLHKFKLLLHGHSTGTRIVPQ